MINWFLTRMPRLLSGVRKVFFLTRMSRPFRGVRTVFSTKDVGKTGYPHAEE